MTPAAPAKKRVTHADLLNLPEHLVGEIINGELVASPRPSGPNIGVASALGFELGPPFQFGRNGGPGGWWILDEPEVELARDVNHVVPDLAGWKKARLPELPSGHVFTVVPDWVCEIISPASIRRDRVEKFHLYAHHDVPFYWLVDPLAQTLEAFARESDRWVSVGAFAKGGRARIAPFADVELDLAMLWASAPGSGSEP